MVKVISVPSELRRYVEDATELWYPCTAIQLNHSASKLKPEPKPRPKAITTKPRRRSSQRKNKQIHKPSTVSATKPLNIGRAITR